MSYAAVISQEFSVREDYVGNIITLLDEGNTIPFGGTVLRQGMESEAVRVLQEYLSFISDYFPEIPDVTPTGYFGPQTLASVEAFQEVVGLPVSGLVNAVTWGAITDLYSDLYIGSRLGEGQYPGSPVGEA